MSEVERAKAIEQITGLTLGEAMTQLMEAHMARNATERRIAEARAAVPWRSTLSSPYEHGWRDALHYVENGELPDE